MLRAPSSRNSQIAANSTLYFAIFIAGLIQPAFAQIKKSDPANLPTDPNAYVQADPQPVTRIILFNSGLSQFVHEGVVTGNQRVGLKFSLHDVDDVLKSLVFEDSSGGTVRAVEYKPAPDNQDVAAKKLGPAMTLAQTLQKYRGEIVTINTRAGKEISGNVLSVENRQTGEDFVETLTITNTDGFVSLPINDFASIKFENEKLREEFELAMIGLTKSRGAELKQIELLFEGKNRRNVKFTYNVDAPIWRMSYRLDLQPDESAIQGWAHIDNVTGVDWKEIELDLRSGRPQSFHVDLFAPVLAERPTYDLSIFDIPTDKALVPQYFGFDPPARLSTAEPSQFSDGSFGGGGFGGGPSVKMPPSRMGINIDSGFRSVAEMDRSNKMVRFQIKDPLSLGAGRSAMVPVLSESLPVKLYSMFTAPVPQAELIATVQNDSITPLIPGPVTIYQDGDFVGEGVLNRIEVGQISELVYGTDLSVYLDTKELPTEKQVKSVSLNDDRIVELQQSTTTRVRYKLKNQDSLKRQFLLRIPISSESFSPAPQRRVGDLAIYELQCDSDSSIELIFAEVAHEKLFSKLADITQKQIDAWQKDKANIEPALLDRVDRIFSQKKKLADVEKQLSDAKEIKSQIIGEQTRLTNIIRVLKPDSKTAEPYLAKLTESEMNLETATKNVNQLQKQAEQVRRVFDGLF